MDCVDHQISCAAVAPLLRLMGHGHVAYHRDFRPEFEMINQNNDALVHITFDNLVPGKKGTGKRKRRGREEEEKVSKGSEM